MERNKLAQPHCIESVKYNGETYCPHEFKEDAAKAERSRITEIVRGMMPHCPFVNSSSHDLGGDCQDCYSSEVLTNLLEKIESEK